MNEIELTSLANFTTYYYGVRAYGYNKLADAPVIRSLFSRVEVTPSRQALNPPSGTPIVGLDDIGIVPNPYKGASSYETSRLDERVRFTNLPDEATTRVFTLSGQLVRTLQKQSSGQTSLDWNVKTESGRNLGSGIYLIHVDVPGVGTRVIKFGFVGGS